MRAHSARLAPSQDEREERRVGWGKEEREGETVAHAHAHAHALRRTTGHAFSRPSPREERHEARALASLQLLVRCLSLSLKMTTPQPDFFLPSVHQAGGWD